MDSFDDQHILLEELYEDSFYPDFLIDKIKYLLEDFINFVEQKPKNMADVDEFEGNSIIYWNENFKIDFLKEFACKLPQINPYR